MNLLKMFEMQKALDDHILDEHPELKGQDNLEWKTLALLVEVGECANEWRGFKKWSKDQEPRDKAKCPHCRGKGFHEYFDPFEMFEPQYSTESCNDCEGTGFEKDKNPLLEEYVDGLHFVLSVGLEHDFVGDVLDYYDSKYVQDHKDSSVTRQFNHVFEAANGIHGYEGLLYSYLALGEMLGFTQEQIEEAYMAKNAINHKRQEQGY